MVYYCPVCGSSQTAEEFKAHKKDNHVSCDGCGQKTYTDEYLVKIKDVKKHIFVTLVGSELRE